MPPAFAVPVVEKPAPRWSGRRFSNRVGLWSGPLDVPGSKHLRRIHAEEALRLCRDRSAEPEPSQKKGDRISCIYLLLTPLQDPTEPKRPTTLNNYAGQRGSFKERLGPRDAFEGLVCWTLTQPKVEPGTFVE